jgi:hypothetical protein
LATSSEKEVKMRFTSFVAALVCTLAVSAVSAHADAGGRTTVVRFGDVTFGPSTPSCPGTTLFQADFPLLSSEGDPLGSGTSCVQGWAAGPCPDPAPPGCHQTTLAEFILTLPEGSITAAMTLEETFVGGEFAVVEHGEGGIVDGTGAFAGATGTVQYDGMFRFPGGVHFTLRIRVS